MRHTYLIAIGALVATGLLGTSVSAGEPVNCAATYIGPPGGNWRVASNWSPGLPRTGDAVCIPDDVGAESMDLPPDLTIRMFQPNRNRKGAAGVAMAGVGLNPIVPPVDAIGACCVQSTCLFSDFFDCREMGGYFRQGVSCVGSTCSTGVCCGENPECLDENGGPMSQSTCETIFGGTFVGGALCDEAKDPCQPHRIPAGYEIHEFIGGTENYRLPPSLNNCGEVVFGRDLAWQLTAEIFLYDNGAITQLTSNDEPDAFPDINDSGTNGTAAVFMGVMAVSHRTVRHAFDLAAWSVVYAVSVGV